MNDFSRQDMQIALQMNTNILLTKLAGRQDIFDAVQCISSRICNKQDIQLILDKNREKLMDKMVHFLQLQQETIDHLTRQLDSIDKKLTSLDDKLTHSSIAGRVMDNGVNREEHNTIFSTMPISSSASGRT